MLAVVAAAAGEAVGETAGAIAGEAAALGDSGSRSLSLSDGINAG